MDNPLRCNNHIDGYCRKELKTHAFVTTCSHIFCRDCVQKHHFNEVAGGDRQCLACGSHLPGKRDVVPVYLAPAEDWQSTVLAGLNPTLITDCAGKAMRFWTYQMGTEIAWQEHLSKEWQNRYSSLHKKAQAVVNEANNEISELQQQIDNLKKEKQEAETRSADLAKAYRDKQESYLRMETLYSTLKHKVQNEHTRGAVVDLVNQTMTTAPRSASDRPAINHGTLPHLNTVKKTTHQARYTADPYGVEQLHPYQRSGSARGATSSDIAPQSMMAPPVRAPGKDVIGRLSATSTPAQRSTLPRISGSHNYAQMSLHRTPSSKAYVTTPAERLAMTNDRSRYNHQAPPTAADLNIHPRTPANRGHY